MIGVMKSDATSVFQFQLPFEGTRDRVRNAAAAGRVVMLKSAREAMLRDDICNLLVIRALTRCELIGQARKGVSKGEWQCTVTFSAKGFRSGGSISLILGEGRVFVEDIHWDPQP